MINKTLRIMLAYIVLPLYALTYPIDGYQITGIKRLLYLQLVINGELKGTMPKPGARLGVNDIKLNLTGVRGDSLENMPAPDQKLQKAIDGLFPNMHESYSIALLDVTPGRQMRYAKRNDLQGFQPGSVAKLIVAAALFNELKNLYPDSFELRQQLLRETQVTGGRWVIHDEHTVPVFNVETKTLKSRVVKEDDVFTLYEWVDHMLSASNNSAASVVWRETLLIHVFGKAYPYLEPEHVQEYFNTTSRAKLSELAVEVVNAPLRDLGISPDEARLGSFFTKEAKKIIPPSGGSLGTPSGFMKYLVAMERGRLVDELSSLEIKRLMYMTARRIRYASSEALNPAAVYFKSGSLYQCREEEGYTCTKYQGNKNNFMNSVIIVEHPDGTTYLVVLMSNVLKKNSAADHNGLATQIDRIIRKG
ncbi:MAG TPA: serine hydrolase [Bacteroidales bacterium]|nr:serine hydrolase [Bacteroidales bacterium]